MIVFDDVRFWWGQSIARPRCYQICWAIRSFRLNDRMGAHPKYWQFHFIWLLTVDFNKTTSHFGRIQSIIIRQNICACEFKAQKSMKKDCKENIVWWFKFENKRHFKMCTFTLCKLVITNFTNKLSALIQKNVPKKKHCYHIFKCFYSHSAWTKKRHNHLIIFVGISIVGHQVYFFFVSLQIENNAMRVSHVGKTTHAD